MKKYLLFVITISLALLAGTVRVFADASGSCGDSGVTWSYTTSNKKLTISGTGAMPNYTTSSSQTTAPWKNYVNDIKSITIANTVTGIGNYAFYKCVNCTTVTYTATSTVESIGNYAFAECSSLTSINVPTTVTSVGTYAYYNCSSATSLTMNNKVGITMTINSNAFKACGFNGTVTIPAKVTSIGMDAFYNCTALKTVNFNASSPLTTIGTWLFEGCSSLTSVTLPPLLTAIPSRTFTGCTSLTSVTIPASVTSVDPSAFYNCTALTTIHAKPDAAPTVSSAWSGITPGNITLQLYSSAANTSYSGNDKWSGFNISTTKSGSCGTSATWELNFVNNRLTIGGSGAMTDYASYSSVPWIADTAYISTIYIGNNITKIGNYAFYQHARCATVTFQSTSKVADIGIYAFKGCKGFTSISLPTSLKTIGSYAFQSCTGLTSVSISSGVTSVGDYAYDGCSNVTSLTLGYNTNSSRTIGEYAFYNCSKVSSISIPACVTSVGNYAFKNCSTATTLTFSGTPTIASIGTYAFQNCGFTSVTLPSSVTTLGMDAFQDCLSLKTADFSAATSLTTFGNWMFANDAALISVLLPPNVEDLKASTFRNCTSLKTIVLPASVTEVNNGAFYGSGIKTIIAKRATTPTLSSSVSNPRPDTVRLAVLTSAAKSAYTAHANWGQFDIDTKVGGECGESGDNVIYELELTTGVLTLSGSGVMATYSTSDRAPWYLYRDLITSVVVESGITGIGAHAFKDCANITTASFPASLTSIGTSAFDGCSTSAFTSYSYAGTISQWLNITFANSSANPMSVVKKCYLNGSNTPVSELIIPNGTTTIKDFAFSNCAGLTSVTLPASLTSIGSSAFASCLNISTVNYSGTITDWCNITFAGSTANPSYYSHNLSIGGELQTSVVLDDELAQIKNYAFYNNSELTLISINHTTTIAADALTNCTANIVVRGQMSGSCGDDVTWTLEDGVLTISGSGAMSNYNSSGNSPWYAVRSAITKLVVEEGVTQLGDYAFYKLANLAQVYLAKDVATINNYAFSGCSSIAFIVSANTTPPAIVDATTGYSGGGYTYGSNTFASVSTSAKIYVPIGSESSYSTSQTYSHNTSSGWMRFSTFLPFTGTCGATGNEENVIWTFDPADNSMTISGVGAMADYNNATAAPWNTLKSTITAVIIEDGITKCGKYTFSNCTALTSISLAASCNSFGTYTFSECTALTEVSIPEGITSTGSWMFHGCTNLVDVTLPSTLTEVDVRTFSQTGITSIDIPEGVTNIDNYAFYYCASLANVGIPSTLTRISSSAFEGCSSLASINLPEGLTNIGTKAFASCTSLAAITIPRSVTTISTSSGSYTFNGCTALRTVNWNAEACADFNKYSSGSGFTYYTPFGDTKASITSFNFGPNVRIIPSCLCQGMTNISIVNLPSSVTEIHMDAFNGCTGLTSITIPANVTSIGSTVFEGCSNIATITSWAETPPTVANANTWTSVPTNATVNVLCLAVEAAYKEYANWARFTGTWNHLYSNCGTLEINTDQTLSVVAPSFYGDITVKEGATLTMDDPTGLDLNIKNLTIEPTARIELASDATYSIKNLIMQRSGDGSNDDVATAQIKGSLTADNLILDFTLDDSRWFPISLPKAVAANAVTVNGVAQTPDGNYYALSYQGDQRAERGPNSDNWEWVTTGNLNANQGYLIGLPSGSKTLRFTMPAYTFNETDDKSVSVNEYAADKPKDAGWNFVGNPYLQAYHNKSDAMTVEGELLAAVVAVSADGEYIVYEETEVSEAIIPPFSAMFIQSPATGSLVFDNSSARKNSPVRRQQTAETTFLQLTLAGNGASARTNFLVNDDYDDSYRIGADLVKWFNDNYQSQAAPTLYSFKSGDRLAFNARSEEMMTDVPVGFYATTDGAYTFSLTNDAEQFEHVLLRDHELNRSIDLKTSDYEFQTAAGTVDTRFTISATLAKQPEIVTDINTINDKQNSTKKIIKDGHLYILHGEDVYTSTGQKVL